MKDWRSHFVFTRSQQNGIFDLVAVIIVLQLVYFFYAFTSEKPLKPEQEKVVLQMQRSVDYLKLAVSE